MRVVIADDERIARHRLRHLLETEPDVEIAAECANGKEAIRAICERDVDAIFLDIQMPGADGLAVARSVPERRLPLVVFVTAYEHYAVEAFGVRAFDYLLKPFDRDRFARTLRNLRQELASTRLLKAHVTPAQPVGSRPNKLQRLAVRNKGGTLVLSPATIDWIEAADNYVCLHCGSATHVLRETMSGLESRLDPAAFVRIHRSAIVNLHRVREIQPWFRGDSRLVLENGAVLTLSRTYRGRVQEALFGLARSMAR